MFMDFILETRIRPSQGKQSVTSIFTWQYQIIRLAKLASYLWNLAALYKMAEVDD